MGIQAWNRGPTRCKVSAGDLICEVNGVRGSCELLLERLTTDSTLRVLFTRPV
eukprot:NODE_9487_length_339_cov_141.158451.p2 GENE.NODE_9487_length_339_cov_141.158451~~NODE_9487_length_339_cov_141.158451.p2  ORF type:complete len:53 (-),score=7.62 NODE_9487_length_339_cov_141.158451:163-321(-)